MKAKLKKSDLLVAVKVVSKAITSRAQLPILSSIKIEVNKEGCFLAATDLYLGIEMKIPVVTSQVGIAIVSGKEFRELLNTAQEGEIELTQENNQLLVKSQDFKAKFSLYNSIDYPEFPQVKGKNIILPLTQLEKIEKRAFFAASSDQTRPLLTGVLLIKSKESWEAVTTDGFRLTKTELVDLDVGEGVESLLVPAQSLKEVISIARDEKVERIKVTISAQNQQLLFQIGEIKVYVRLLEGEYPPYQKIIPSSFSLRAEVDREQLLNHVKRALIFCQNTSNIVRFSLNKTLEVSAVSSTLGTYQGEVELEKMEGESNNVAFNGRYLLDYLSSSDQTGVIFMMVEPLKPVVFCWPDNPKSIYVVMPFRVNN